MAMVIAILALLGVPLWLLLGWLAAGAWHRHENKQIPGNFNLKVRMVSGSYRNVDDDFGRLAGMGVWAHDVLICEKGLLIPRNLHFKVAEGVQGPQAADADEIKRLGDSPVTMQFQLDHDAVLEIAVPGEMVDLGKGPFFSGPNEYSDATAAVVEQPEGQAQKMVEQVAGETTVSNG